MAMEVGEGLVRGGLASDEAARRLADDGPNELPTARGRSLLEQVWAVVREPMLVLLIGAGTVNLLLSEPLDAIVLTATVFIIVGISIYQERKTETALVALRDLSSPRALVLRDGVQRRIAGREVVRGDVVLLAEGDRVPADGVLLRSSGLTVDESTLTGESVPVRKVVAPTDADADAPMGAPGGDGTPWVFAGTLAVKGRGIALVRATGPRSELGRIGAALRDIEPDRTPLQAEIGRIVRVIAVLGIGAAAAVVVVYGLTRGAWLEATLAGIATAMAMLPEEFPVVFTVFLALGAWRMSRQHVLTRRVPVIEALGSVTVLCVDKTGTLTMNRMLVSELVVGGDPYVLDDAPLPPRFLDLVDHAVLASPVDPFDPMDRAFRELGGRLLPAGDRAHDGWDLVREYPLSEDLLALSHAWRPPDGGPIVVAAKGAPEAVATLCRLEGAALERLTAEVERATSGGQRVLAVARAVFAREEDLPEDQRDLPFTYLGLTGLRDPVRPGAADAVAECARAGIRTVMITGDYPGTAMAIAREIGLDGAATCVTGPELAAMDDAELARRIGSVAVFARVVPQQKLRIVRALQAVGEVVGMTGDGVNDAPALRAADIGIALGARGTDVAREAAALVITDDDFTSIVRGVRQGRGIFDNLRKAMSYLIAVHVTIFGMSLVPVLVPGWPLVLLPIQIAFLEFIIDPTCSIVFESEGLDPKVMEQPPRAPGAPLFGRRGLWLAGLQGLSSLAAVLGVYGWAELGGRADGAVRSVTFAALVCSNLALILVNRSWTLPAWRALRERRNPALRWILVAATGLLLVALVVPVARRAFDFGPIGPLDWAVALGAAVLGVSWFEVYKRVAGARRA
ncbi:MAG: cation-translocating P-type ATPase [Actinomycetota bacterium]